MKKIVCVTIGVIAMVASAWGQTPAKPDERTLAEAYTYLLGRVLVIRQEHIDRKGENFAFNAIKYNRWLHLADALNPF
jgi:hypothetical protein